MSTPAQNIHPHYSGIDARRSSRLERTVPLVIQGIDKFGQTFLEDTSAVSLNLHGCRYPSRHEYPLESHITLKVTGINDQAHDPVVRARVRSISAPQTRRELCQVGVEFERPANVWGIDAPPDDWQYWLGEVPAMTSSLPAAAPALEPAQPASQEWRTEVTMFPAPTPAPVLSDRAKENVLGKAERSIATSDELLAALQRKLQQAADKAILNATRTQLDDVVRKAIDRIDEAWKTNVRQSEEYAVARIAALQSRAEEQLASHQRRTEEIAHQVELLLSSARNNLSETQRIVDQVTRELEPQLYARLNESFGCASRELENAASHLSERQFDNFSQGAQAVLQEVLMQLEARIAAVRSLLEDTVPSPQNMESLKHAIKQETLGCVEARLQEMRGYWEEQQNLQRDRLEEIAQKLERLAGSAAADSGDPHQIAKQAARELRPQVCAMLDKSVGRATKDLEIAAARVADRQFGRITEERQRVAQEAALEIEAGAREARSLLQKAANITLDEFRRQAKVEIDLVLSEGTQRMTSSLASLDAENRAAFDACRGALMGDVTRFAEQSAQEFRAGIKAFLYSCLVAAVSAVDEHAQTTLHGFGNNPIKLSPELLAALETSRQSGKDSSSDSNSH